MIIKISDTILAKKNWCDLQRKSAPKILQGDKNKLYFSRILGLPKKNVLQKIQVDLNKLLKSTSSMHLGPTAIDISQISDLFCQKV